MSKQVFFTSCTLDEDGKFIQVGNKCRSCGKTSFPSVEFCPFCSSDDGEKVPLSTIGTVFSWTITRVPVGPYKPPYIGAYIDLPEGTRLFAQIHHANEDELKIGMKVKMEPGVLWTEKDGTEVIGYYYVPVDANDGGAE
jgi:uncharacterized OB-fold protein